MTHPAPGRLVLHIGPHKTATTYIQQNLSHDAETLQQAGWTYPSLGRLGLPGHHDLAHTPDSYLPPSGAHHAALAALGTTSTGNMVLSAEGFCRWTPEQFLTLAGILGRDSVELVYVVRDPVDLFYSYWGEEVKQGHTFSLAERMAMHFNDPMASRLLNPMQDLAPLIAAQGIKVWVVPFTTLQAAGTDIYQHIAHVVLGVPLTVNPQAVAKNTAFPIELTEFLRLILLVEAEGRRHIGSALRHSFMRATTSKERNGFVQLIRQHGRMARRNIGFERPSFKTQIAEGLIAALGPNWTRTPEAQTLFKTTPQQYVSYNEHQLFSVDAIRSEVLTQHARAKT